LFKKKKNMDTPPRKKKPLAFLFVDCEMDGPCPGLHSMLSLGAVVFLSTTQGIQWIDSFTCNLRPLPDTQPHPSTLHWWAKHPAAYSKTQSNPLEPQKAISNFADFIKKTRESYYLQAVAKPAAVDWQFINYYFHRFFGSNPIGYSCLDLGSYLWAFFGTESPAERWPLEDYEDDSHPTTHIALEDAKHDASIFHAIYQENTQRLSHFQRIQGAHTPRPMGSFRSTSFVGALAYHQRYQTPGLQGAFTPSSV
jgi:hypothetical protein